MTAERGANPHVRVHLDGNPQPLIDHELPTDIALDTLSLADSAHRLAIRSRLILSKDNKFRPMWNTSVAVVSISSRTTDRGIPHWAELVILRKDETATDRQAVCA